MTASPVVALVDHGMGNLRSVAKGLEAAGAEVRVAGRPEDASDATALCVPGQGVFGHCVAAMRSSGWDETVAAFVDEGRPYLGICLGMQVLFEHSDEGDAEGLGLLRGAVRKLDGGVRVPHIGWNTVGGPGKQSEYFYFDHSFAVSPKDEDIVSGWTDHGRRFAATVTSGSLVGVQFHPEKSGRAGVAFLRGWVKAI